MRCITLLTLFLFIASSNLCGQSIDNNAGIDSNLYSKYEIALEFMNSSKVDSAGEILDTILVKIRDTDIYDTPFGLRVQLQKALALERDNVGDLALLALQEVKEKASKNKVWDVYSIASINLGLIYEIIGKNIDCIQNLRDAQKVLVQHPELDYIYPLFYVRLSSYHRIYESRDSAISYAKECLRIYEKNNDLAQGGDALMLMTILSDDKDIAVRLKYAKAAVEIYKKTQNHDALGYMYTSISRFYYSKNQFEKALIYNDTTISEAIKNIEGGFDVYYLLYTAYKFRGEIFSQLKQHDSASYYVTKGYELHNQHIQQENYNKVLEMDAKYKDDKKALKIEEQAKQLKSAKTQKLLLQVIFGLVTFFAIGLIYYYNKLRKANRQTKLQAEQIKKANEELSISLNKQIVLQGEVHHRVKNNLQVIISLLELQKEDLKNEEAKNNIDSMSKRIYSMAAIHNLLYQKEDMEFIKLHDYVENLCYHFSNFSLEEDKPQFNLQIDDIKLNLETSMPIGIIITELLTNSLKYARVSIQKLKIDIQINRLDRKLYINYHDNGPGFEERAGLDRKLYINYHDNGPGFEERAGDENPGGLGFYILESMTRQLQGKIIRKNENGASYEVHLVEKNNWKKEDVFESQNKS